MIPVSGGPDAALGQRHVGGLDERVPRSGRQRRLQGRAGGWTPAEIDPGLRGRRRQGDRRADATGGCAAGDGSERYLEMKRTFGPRPFDRWGYRHRRALRRILRPPPREFSGCCIDPAAVCPTTDADYRRTTERECRVGRGAARLGHGDRPCPG